MATTYYGDNKTKIDAIKPTSILDAGVMGGKMRVLFDTVTFVTATGLPIVGDIVELGAELPVGARVLDVVFLNHDASTTWNIGDYEDTDRYIAAAAVSAISRLDEVPTIPNVGYEVDMTTASTPDNQIIATAATAKVTTGTIISIAITYVVE